MSNNGTKPDTELLDTEEEKVYDTVATITIFFSKDECMMFEAADEPHQDDETGYWTYLDVYGRRATLIVPDGWLVLIQVELDDEEGEE